MHKIWMSVDPKRAIFAGVLGFFALGALLHIVVLSGPRHCDHWGWCATSPVYVPGQPPQIPGR